MADLDLSNYTNWQPIGNSSAPFSGQFDGNGFIIKNLTISRPNELYQGLFGYISSTGVITNLTLENAVEIEFLICLLFAEFKLKYHVKRHKNMI